MSINMLTQNLLSAPILFFMTGFLARLMRSDLEVPSPLPKLFSLFLLTAIGLKGGVELSHTGFSPHILLTLGAAMLMALFVPFWVFALMRRKFDASNSAALAATYGSVSAVTFITAGAFLQKLQIPFGGHVVAALALMESPAIIVGVFLARRAGKSAATEKTQWSQLLHEACCNGSVFLLMASLVIGLVLGAERTADIQPFFGGLFKGMLCLFLLDMGIVAARRSRDLLRGGAFLIVASVLIPLVNAAIALVIAKMLGMSVGDALMFTVLCASASYIAVPAAMSLALPDANPSIYVSMALALTFPFNVLIGIPLYLQIIQSLWSA